MNNSNKNQEKNQKNNPQDQLISAKKELEEFKLNLEKQISQLGYEGISIEEFKKMSEPNIDEDPDLTRKVLLLKEECEKYFDYKSKLDDAIILTPSNLNEVINSAEDLLFKYSLDKGIFQRSRSIVRVIRAKFLPEEKRFKRSRAKDAAIIQEVDQAYLTLLLSELGKFSRLDSNGNICQINCPEKISKYLLAKKEWKLPMLTGIINTPTLRYDGSILDKQGYDEFSGLLLVSNEFDFEKIPENPTPQEIEEAKNIILRIFKDFPFENEASLSVALAAVLTALIRKSIPTAPLFGFSAPVMSSGKSLLADIVSLVLTGRPNGVISLTDSETEERKRILSILLEGESLVCYDNVDKPFGNATFCSILTQQEYKDRILNKNETKTVPTNITFLVTGNNLTFIGDISTRALICKLDPKVERPEERRFDLNLYEYIPQNRGMLVSKFLTLLRGYIVAGKPKQDFKQYARFEEWSDLVRATIVWLGLADPCETRKDIEEEDPIRLQLSALFNSWYEIFGDEEVKVRELIDKANSSEEKSHALKEALIEMSGNKGEINVHKLPRKLASFKNLFAGWHRVLNKGANQATTFRAVEQIATQ